MRLHELSVTAFGPFVETVHVDFDELSAGGLFLLTGDTGAGKTSVLDAVCFAIYGEVPGDRHSARHLRSDNAEADAEPRVVLRLSIGERTFRFTRSPAWERPKRRGAGTVRVQAHVVVEELRGGEWTGLTNRLDEAGQLVTGLLGMTCSQFTQVAMLPQGRFQAFLRATSSERHAVLQRLFRTRRFEEVERWLVERRTQLRRRSQTFHDRCAGVVNRFQEAAGTGVPDGWDLHDLDPVVDDGTLDAWAAALTDEAAERVDECLQALATAESRLEGSREASEEGKRTAEARSRGEQARQTLAELDRTAEQETLLAEALDAHRRAETVLPASVRVEQATRAMAGAEATASAHLGVAAARLDLPDEDLSPATLSAAATRAAEARAVAESWLPRERELHDERARRTALAARKARLEATVVAAQGEREDLAEVLRLEQPQLEAAKGTAAGLGQARSALAAAEAGLDAARQAAVLDQELDGVRVRLREATRHALDLREHYLDLRERRISGMAAELAGALAAGCSCPVCGSAEHPSPAVASGQVSRSDEEAAREAYESADFESQALKEAATALEARVAVERSRGGGRAEAEWRQEVASAQTALDLALAATRTQEALEVRLAELVRRDQRLSADLAAARATLEATCSQQLDVERRCADLSAELAELLAGEPAASSVAELVERQAETVAVLESACKALTAHERAAEEIARAEAAAESAATSAGFATFREATQALLPRAQAAARSEELQDRRAARTGATAVLDDPRVTDALAEAPPDLPALAAAVRQAQLDRDHAHAGHEHAAVRAARLEALLGDLRRVLSTWAPVRHEHAVVSGLSSLVEGRSADNQLKMRLSAFVLSERLRQVVAAANERLGTMTDERFTLEQADVKGAGEQRGGLSLRVRDEWNGKERDPATLSGGETFLVSLALALGLADTVAHAAGGTDLETLFIDEGFGALDARTLDAVMDTLDTLRDGGRVVGLVSHVPELRTRVTSQLEVRKARHGSTLRTMVATA
jgi:exonuclease SbcC